MLKLPFSRTVKSYVEDKQFKKKIYSSNWAFSFKRVHMIKTEGDDWVRSYLPVDVSGKVVLDVGAGEGETAKLFLERGARKVICVECDSESLYYLRLNARLHPEISVVARRFHLSDLFVKEYDFMKMDIEGFEEVILSRVLPKPSVVEVHGLQLRERFLKAGFRIADHFGTGFWCCYGYWGC